MDKTTTKKGLMKQGTDQSTYRNSVAIGLVLLLLNCTAGYGVDRYVSLEGGHVPPFTDWASAATNIQEAIDASVEGDVIWVTNGLYATGGKVMAGDLTNRVALDKALTVRSVNGPTVTTIQGQWDAANTNGPGAVRCAWLTNGAMVVGFTLQGGATRATGDPISALQGGGGVLCASSNAVVENCRITRNAAVYGGGAYGGTLINCAIEYNIAAADGGGAYSQYLGGTHAAYLNACGIVGNVASRGGGTAFATLNQCKLRNNQAEYGGGVYGGNINNCEILGNSASVHGGGVHASSFGGLIANNSRITGNSATIDGGGTYAATSGQATLKNCTVTGNSAGASGGGTFGGTLRNCISGKPQADGR
jgi:hypothetical protein